MVGLVVVSHSASLAEGVVELAREMGGEEVPIEAAGGLDDGSVGTDAARVHAAIERAMSEAGVLVLMDLGSALMSAEMATEMLEDGARVQLSEAPLVEGAVAAAAAARVGGSLDEVAREARGALAMKSSQLEVDGPPGDAGGGADRRRRRRGAHHGPERDRPARPPGGAGGRAGVAARRGPAAREGGWRNTGERPQPHRADDARRAAGGRAPRHRVRPWRPGGDRRARGARARGLRGGGGCT